MNKKQTTLGILVIAAGLVVFLANINFGVMRDIVDHWWPVVIILAGVFMLWSNSRNYAWSLLVVLIGSILLVNSLGLASVDLGDVILPVLMVGFGFSILVGSRHKNSLDIVLKKDEDITALMGGVTGKNTSDDYRGGNINAVMGGVELDLGQVTIKKDAVLRVWMLMGGLELRVPENVIVKNRTTSLLGGVEDKTKPVASKSAPVLYLDGTVVMGGIEIKR